MNWLLTTVLCAALVELVLRLPLVNAVKVLHRSSGRALHVLAAKSVSDHWKEKAMGAFARMTFVASLRVAGLLATVLGAAALLVLALDRLSDGFQAFILGWTGLGGGIVAASLYLVARRAVLRG